MSKLARVFQLCLLILSTTACTTINVDHVKLEERIELSEGDAIVVLGRRHSAQGETESSLVQCIGDKLQRGTSNVRVISEQQFIDSFYPWFEARTAPLHPNKLSVVLGNPLVSARMTELNIKYFVWVEGSTERTDSAGVMSCGISGAGGGCFGFSSWEDTSDYETTIWDLESLSEVGRVSTEAVGTSYMPAFIVPIPFLASVQGDACVGMGKQLVQFFQDDTQALKRLK